MPHTFSRNDLKTLPTTTRLFDLQRVQDGLVRTAFAGKTTISIPSDLFSEFKFKTPLKKDHQVKLEADVTELKRLCVRLPSAFSKVSTLPLTLFDLKLSAFFSFLFLFLFSFSVFLTFSIIPYIVFTQFGQLGFDS